MHPQLLLLTDALHGEEAWQRQEHERLRHLPLPERVANGISLGPLQVEVAEPASRGREFLRLRGPALHDGITAGDPVLVGSLGDPNAGVDGICLGGDARTLDVLADAPLPFDGPAVVTKRFDARTFRRYRDALEGDTRGAVAKVLLGLSEPGEAPPELHDSPRFDHLNAPQRHAARTALSAADVSLIHGPPGTGKTTVLVALLRALADREERAWALADSNAAVDNLAVRAARTGLDVVRIGHPARIGSEAAALSLDARVLAGPYGDALKKLDREAIKARSRGHWRDLRSLLAERDGIETSARAAILDRAEVIAATLGTLAFMAPRLPRASIAVVDEATQAIEPAIWTAVPFVERLVLVGDPCQLGPVVMEPGNPLERSLLDRLLDPSDPAGGRLPMPMLAVQHRMHAAIQDLVQPAYDAPLIAHDAVRAHLLADLPAVTATDLTSRPTLWVDTAGAGFEEQRDPVTSSLYNRGEHRVIAQAIGLLLEAGVAAEQIGVITPYSAQVGALANDPRLEGVEIATVNAFQGRDKEAILVSFVRSNPDGDLGFVADERRLTVALSRARRLLLCVGDSATLAGHPRYARVLDDLGAQGAVQSIWEPPWFEGSLSS